MATYRLLTPDEHYAFKQLKLTWWFGVDAIILADGNYVFPDRVYPAITNLIDEGKITEYEVEEYKMKVKYLDGNSDEQEIEIEWDNPDQFTEIEDPEFPEYSEP